MTTSTFFSLPTYFRISESSRVDMRWDESASNFEASSPMPPNGALTCEVHNLLHPTVLKQIAAVTINPSNSWQVSSSYCTGTAFFNTMGNFIFRYKLSLLQSFYIDRIPVFNLLEHGFLLSSYPYMVPTWFTQPWCLGELQIVQARFPTSPSCKYWPTQSRFINLPQRQIWCASSALHPTNMQVSDSISDIILHPFVQLSVWLAFLDSE